MHNWTSLQLPATPLCRTRCVHNTPVKFITAAYASHYVAGHQRQVTWQRKPVTLAALRVMRHERVTQLRSAAIFAHGCPDEAWAETLVVVEGLSDRRAVWKAVPAQVFVLHGASKSSATATAQLLKDLAANYSRVIALLDPDVAGRQSRTVIDACLPGKCLHAFLPVWQATAPKDIRSKLAGDVGVEHATPNHIRQALIEARPSCPGRKEFVRADLVTWALLAEMGTDLALQPGCVQRRAAVSAALGLGNCDGKQLLRQLNAYGFSRQHVSHALAAIQAPRATAPVVGTLSTVSQ